MTESNLTPMLVDVVESDLAQPDHEVTDFTVYAVHDLAEELMVMRQAHQWDELQDVINGLSHSALRFIAFELMLLLAYERDDD
jgi:hypothetical protein